MRAVLFALLLVSIAPALADKYTPTQMACQAAQLTIKKKIESPARARFPSCLETAATVRRTVTKRGTEWYVMSWVEVPDASGIYRGHQYEVLLVEGAGGGYDTAILSLR